MKEEGLIMGNMGYCRFQNTLSDLQDCFDHMYTDDLLALSEDELRARKQLIDLCYEITQDAKDNGDIEDDYRRDR